jgi:hypothetical protein
MVNIPVVNNYITASCIISKYVAYKDAEKIFENEEAVVPDFLSSLYHYFNSKYPKFYKMDNLSKLGWLAAEILLKDNFNIDKYKAEEIGVVLANTNSSLDTDIKYYETAKDIASPALFVYTLPNIVIGEICIRHHFKGENAFFICEQFDGEFIEQYVTNLINNNILQACICGWVELLNDQYKTVLFLVEKEASPGSMLFTNENINKTYQLENG